MAKSFFNKSALSYIGIVASFFVIAYLYLFPLLEGQVLRTNDLMQHQGMAKELRDYRNETGEEGLWTNSMFCGMPAYLISIDYPGNLISPIIGTITSKTYPAGMIILYFIGFFILLSSMKMNKWLSLIGAFAFAFSSYFIIIIGAGHTSKAYAIGYLPVIGAGLLLLFQNKKLAGILLYTLGLTLEIAATHYQITYYGAILFFIYLVVEFIYSVKEKIIPGFVKNAFIILAGTIVALGINFSSLYTTYEYSQQTIRGPSELSLEKENRTTGLNKEYIVRWSQGIDETLSLLIPNFKGGSSDTRPDNSSNAYQVMRQRRMPDIDKGLSQILFYHGGKPGTAGPVYAGAIVVFLFVLGLFLIKGRYKWWLLSATLVSILLSWGKNVMGLTSFLLDVLPMYNKFRAPEMILVIAEFTIPLLGFLALSKIINGEIDKKELFKGLKWSIIITGGITLLFSVLPGIFDDFQAHTDFNKSGKLVYPDWLYSEIIKDRKNLLRSDAFRSFIFIMLSAAVLFFAFYKEKLKTGVAILLLGLLIFGDLWIIDKRYFNNNNFEKRREARNAYVPNVAVNSILQDTDPNYRVLPLNNRFNNSYYSYFHKNIMGYHAAKLSRPHEVMNFYVVDEMEKMYLNFKEQVNPTVVPEGSRLINMLNARYLIYADNRPPMKNPYAMGNAWFVDTVKIVADADEEFLSLKDFDPVTTALVDKRFKEQVNKTVFEPKANDKIVFTEYKPNYLKYTSSCSEEQFAVFSEVYYDKGWDAFIDGKKVPYLRANYMLRGMVIPKGEHEIEFEFHPKSYFIGNKISLASSLLLILAIAGYLFIEIKKVLATKTPLAKN